MGVPIPQYCDGCAKIIQGRCGAYPDPCKKVGGWMGAWGCSFSPMEKAEEDKKKVRVGQQKTKRIKGVQP